MCTPHLIHGTFGPQESALQTASGSVDAGLTDVLNTQTDRQTDHETCRVCSKKPQMCDACDARKCQITPEGEASEAKMIFAPQKQIITPLPYSRGL